MGRSSVYGHGKNRQGRSFQGRRAHRTAQIRHIGLAGAQFFKGKGPAPHKMALLSNGKEKLQIPDGPFLFLRSGQRLQKSRHRRQIIRSKHRIPGAGNPSILVKHCPFSHCRVHGIHVHGKQKRLSGQAAAAAGQQIPAVSSRLFSRVVLLHRKAQAKKSLFQIIGHLPLSIGRRVDGHQPGKFLCHSLCAHHLSSYSSASL